MTSKTSAPTVLPTASLARVTGGIGITFPNMGAPEYSAEWWANMKAAGHVAK